MTQQRPWRTPAFHSLGYNGLKMTGKGVAEMYVDAIEAFFSRKTMRELANDSQPEALSPALASFLASQGCATLEDGVRCLYGYLFRHHRSEYIFKATLLNKIVFGRHSPRTSTAFEELPVGNSIADFVVINGKATVYEIKTDLDTLRRLDAQIGDYYAAFDNVVIVCGSHNVQEVLSRYGESSVGVCLLTDRGALSMKKEPDPVASCLSHKAMFDILRKGERDEVLKRLGMDPRPVAPVFHYTARLAEFEKVSTGRAYEAFKEVLKQRGRQVDGSAIEGLPKELRMLGYFTGVSEGGSEIVKARLAMPMT